MIEPCGHCGKNYCWGDCYGDDAPAQGMSAGTAQGEARQPGGEAMRPDDGATDKEKGAGQ